MSANNALTITRDRDDKCKWVIRDKCVETDEKGYLVGKADFLEEAIRIANEYMEKEMVEYGLNIDIN